MRVHPRSSAWFLGTITVAAIAVAGAACGDSGREARLGPTEERAALDTGAAVLVGSGECTDCHETAAAAWSGSHHDLAMDAATDATVLGAFDGRSLTHDGVTTTFRRDGDRFVVRADSPDGEMADFRVTHVFGVVPLQQYMVSFEDGRRQMLRQAWDTRPADAGGQRWFALYPEESIDAANALHWTRPSQTWNHMCAECHSTDLRKGYDVETGRYDTRFAEIDVACEACHGPGSRHVAWARKLGDAYDPFEHDVEGLTVDLRRPKRKWEIDSETGTAVVVPRTTPSPQIETCARCHSRRGQIARESVAGQSLLQTHRPALLSDGLYYADGQIDDEVFVYGSFLQSRMYSAGVECSDCHEPHGLGLRAERNELCTRCHDATRFDAKQHHFHEPGTESALCTACHMPTKNYMVVDPRHDHSLRVPRPDLTLSIGVPNACDDCHADRGTEWSVAAVERWYGTRKRPTHPGEVLAFGRRGGPGAAQALAHLASDPSAAGIVRATALSLLASSPGHPAVARAVFLTRDDADPLVRLGSANALAALSLSQRVAAGGPLLSDDVRAVRIDAAAQLVLVPREALPEALQLDLDAALGELRAAAELDADQPESRVNLGNVERALGNVAAAETLYRKAIALDDAFMPAYVNLADALREHGQDDEGEVVLRRGIDRFPNDPSLHHALGLLLIRSGRRAEAERALAVAAQSRTNPRAEMAYALLVQARGDHDVAISLLTDSVQRYPGDADLVSALLGAHLQRGEAKSALRWAEHLLLLRPTDEQLASLIGKLRSR